MHSLIYRRSLLLLLLAGAICLPGIQAQAQIQGQKEVSLPDTPVGKQFAAWLAALNTGERETLRQFIAGHMAPPPNGVVPTDGITERHFGIYQATHGLEVRKILASSPERITVFVQAKRTGYGMSVRMAVTAQPPYNIQGFGFRNTPAPADLLPSPRLNEREIRDRTDALITRLVESNAFSGVVMVAKEGKPIYTRACGMASRAWNRPNRIDTKFNIASIGKMFTAVAIAQLEEQGKLSYDDPLGKLLPDYANKEIAQKVTVQHLLSHTSGLVEAPPSPGEKTGATRFRTIKECLATSANDTLKFAPGTKLEYSNYGYLVLGAIIERVSGQNYYDYIREHIYKPAGMLHTDSYELENDPPNLASGYMDAPGGTRRDNIFMLPPQGLPYGLGYSTAEDMVKFNTALCNHTLLNAKSLETVWTGRMDYTEPDSQYGYGCIVTQYNGTRIIGHGGGWVGITDKFDMYPDLGYTVVILTNIDSDPNPIAYKLREWLTQGHSR